MFSRTFEALPLEIDEELNTYTDLNIQLKHKFLCPAEAVFPRDIVIPDGVKITREYEVEREIPEVVGDHLSQDPPADTTIIPNHSFLFWLGIVCWR